MIFLVYCIVSLFTRNCMNCMFVLSPGPTQYISYAYGRIACLCWKSH